MDGIIRRREMEGEKPILLYSVVSSSESNLVGTPKFTSDKLEQIKGAKTITAFVYPVEPVGTTGAQSCSVRSDWVGYYNIDCFPSKTVLFASNAGETYYKSTSQVEGYLNSTSVPNKSKWTNANGEVSESNTNASFSRNTTWNKLTTSYAFRAVAGTKFGIGTRLEIWLNFEEV